MEFNFTFVAAFLSLVLILLVGTGFVYADHAACLRSPRNLPSFILFYIPR